MIVEYTNRAVADLRNIAAYYEGLGIPGLGDRIAERFDRVIARIAPVRTAGVQCRHALAHASHRSSGTPT
jgi:hypothetical protein